MTEVAAPALAVTRAEVEDFLYEEAQLLDEWRLDEWLEMFTEDAMYTVPCTDLLTGNASENLVIINDDMKRLRGRVERLNSRKAHREFPWSRTRRLITNVRIVANHSAQGEIDVEANFLIYRFRNEEHQTFVGHYRHRLVRADERLLFRTRRVELDLEALRPHGTVSVLI